jgi:hypothetical protein
MITQSVVPQHRNWVWGLRIGFFAFGALILVLWFTNDFLGPFGLSHAGLLIILSFLVGAAVRHPFGWALLIFTAVGAALQFVVGMGVMFDLAGGNQDSLLGGIGFFLSLFGLLFFYPSAFTSLVVALRLLAHDWRDRDGGVAAPPPTTSH